MESIPPLGCFGLALGLAASLPAHSPLSWLCRLGELAVPNTHMADVLLPLAAL
jgi:hypothetical protein